MCSWQHLSRSPSCPTQWAMAPQVRAELTPGKRPSGRRRWWPACPGAAQTHRCAPAPALQAAAILRMARELLVHISRRYHSWKARHQSHEWSCQRCSSGVLLYVRTHSSFLSSQCAALNRLDRRRQHNIEMRMAQKALPCHLGVSEVASMRPCLSSATTRSTPTRSTALMGR